MKLVFKQGRARVKQICGQCNGNGIIPDKQDPEHYWELCKACMGTGMMNHPRKSKKL